MQPMTKKRIRGVSMIELLVAVLVMGIGVLGITGLQMVSLQNNRSALQRSEAVQLAYDMMDRIRTNRGNGAVPGIAYDGIDIGDAPPGFQNCLAANCSTAQMVSFDITTWKCALGGFDGDAACTAAVAANALFDSSVQPGLPLGDGSISVNGATGVITITVQWQPANTPNPLTVTIDSQG